MIGTNDSPNDPKTYFIERTPYHEQSFKDLIIFNVVISIAPEQDTRTVSFDEVAIPDGLFLRFICLV